jgi:hypothetical protein
VTGPVTGAAGHHRPYEGQQQQIQVAHDRAPVEVIIVSTRGSIVTNCALPPSPAGGHPR